MSSSTTEQQIKVNSMSGEPLATICAPADGLTLSVIKKILGGNEYRKFPERFDNPMTIIDIGANVGASPLFILYDFSMDCVHRGLMTYLAKKSASKIPDIDSSRIRRR